MVKAKNISRKIKKQKNRKRKFFKLKHGDNDVEQKKTQRDEGPKFMENDEEKNAVGMFVKTPNKNGPASQKKKGKKRKHEETGPLEEEVPSKVALTRFSDDPPSKKDKWINRQRVLVFGCRGISHRDRHLMNDIRTLMPHSRPENKMERRENLLVVNEMCEMKNCNKCILFEGRLKRDIYLWVSNVPTGPSVKFLLENVYTMEELKFTGNCLAGSRPLLSFDKHFDERPHYRVLKELFTQVFGTPNHHPKSQPFVDHVYSFSVLDNRIWFRNYQILSEDGALVEIGPRFIMNPVKIFGGSFGGETLWENPFYVTPARHRQMVKKAASFKYVNRVQQKILNENTKPEQSYVLQETDSVFATDTVEQAKTFVADVHKKQQQETSKKKGSKKKFKKNKKKAQKYKGKKAQKS